MRVWIDLENKTLGGCCKAKDFSENVKMLKDYLGVEYETY